MHFAPILAISTAVITLALVTVFAAGWYAGSRERGRRPSPLPDDQPTATRISLADLRARMRRLEAIAAGIDV